ncbi:MAG: DNA repair protein RecO [Minisyncoccia bacterium]
MSTYKTEGIIIRRNNFGESSLILNIYTKDYGKIEAVARSARKAKGKLKGHLELFLHTDLILANGRNIDTITSSMTTEPFFNLRKDLKLLFSAHFIVELADKITEERYKDSRIFNLLGRIFYFFDGLGKEDRKKGYDLKLKLAILLYQIHIADLSGFSSHLDKCVFCSKKITPNDNYFSFSFGGILDSGCASHDPEAILIGDNSIKLLRFFQFRQRSVEEYDMHLNKCFENLKKLKIDEKSVSKAIFLMNRFIEFNIDRKIKSIDFIYK